MKKLLIILSVCVIVLCMYLYVKANPPVGSRNAEGIFAFSGGFAL